MMLIKNKKPRRKSPGWHTEDRTNTKERFCLKCEEKFDSVWIGNRICPRCTLTNQKHG